MLGCIIQARLGSSRLPMKIMKLLDAKNSVLDYVINQLKFSKCIDKIVIATTTLDEDILLVEYAKKHDLNYFCGSKDDVLDRYYQCARNFSFSTIVRVTSALISRPEAVVSLVSLCRPLMTITAVATGSIEIV